MEALEGVIYISCLTVNKRNMFQSLCSVFNEDILQSVRLKSVCYLIHDHIRILEVSQHPGWGLQGCRRQWIKAG